jgi:subtilisin family serine protease
MQIFNYFYQMVQSYRGQTLFLKAFLLLIIAAFFILIPPLAKYQSCRANAIAAEQTINILVGFKPDAVMEPLPAGVISWHKIGRSWIFRMKVISSQADNVIKKLKTRSDVRYVEKSKRGKFQSDSSVINSPAIADLSESNWYQSIKGDSIADLSWGAGALVAVLDTGIDSQNQIFDSGIFINSGEIPDDMVDNDGNGYIDDVRGWDIGDNDNNPLDENGHGTEISSIIMAVAPHCRILPVKIDQAGDDSFETADLVEGIYYAISMGVKVINLSLTADQDLESVAESIHAAHDAGIVVVAAAGNDGGSVEFPASMDETIAVGSLNGDYPEKMKL